VIARRLEMRNVSIEQWLFEKKHAAIAREARHQVLWTLKDEVPS
jgi:type IV secretory pathway VirD2 relaxase